MRWQRLMGASTIRKKAMTALDGCFSTSGVNMLSVRAFNQLTPLVHVWVTPPGWQEVVRAMENSRYFESLEAKAKEKYREKLSCAGLSTQDDPYLPKNDARFVNHMATCQSVGQRRLGPPVHQRISVSRTQSAYDSLLAWGVLKRVNSKIGNGVKGH